MAKAEEITIPIKVDFRIDKKAAESCLKIVELYVNCSDEVIHASPNPYGGVEYTFVKG